ncbi:MAG TPA: hypothetical protein EYP85_15780 [Armatimonadetes bacterium]|nr:hypothetical protein [Armatimonadota bacterium]
MRIETWFFLGLAGVAATTATFGAASDFPPLNEKVGWLKTERLRGTLFHNPTVQPMFKRFLVRPEVAPRKPAEPIEAVGETYVVLLPDDGVVAAVVEGIRGVEAFPETIYALFDEAGRELSTGKVSPGKSAPIRVAGQQGPCTLLVNSGPALRNLARIRPQTQFWAVDVRSHAAYDRTPLHYHFLRDLKLGGFNLALIDFERLEDAFETEEGLASWAEKVKGWADYARQVGLRIMPTVNLGGSPAEVRAWGDSRPGLYIEPKENLPLAPCPLDRHYWERLYLRRGRVVARLSLENPYVVGYGLDPEMYQCWSYGHYMLSGTCFCDYCLGGFLKAKNLSLDPLTQKQTGKERYEWLRREGLYQDYDQYLEDQMADLARWCREELQAINPNLLLNMFVIEIGNWFCRGVARGFGREGVPVVNFCEHTYYGVGYDPQWLDRITTDFRNWGAYVLQGSAVWDLFFPATEPRFIAAHCYNLATKAQGYFYWPGDNLYRDWGCRHAFFNRPAYWDEYWSALVWTNQEIDRTLAEPGRESPLDAWEPVPWRGKRNRETGGWNTAEAVARIHREKAYPLILAAPTTLYVRIPEPAGMLTVAARTRGKGSAAQLTLLGPEGRKAASGTVTSKEETTLEVKDASPGLWQILIEPSPQGHFTEVGLALRAGGPYLATSPEVLPLAPTKPRGLIGYWSLKFYTLC